MKRAIAASYAAFNRRVDAGARIVFLSLIIVAVLVGVGIYNDHGSEQASEKISPAEHLKRARDACGFSGDKLDSKCLSPSDAYIDLWAIPRTAPEYDAASRMLIFIQQEQRNEEGATQQEQNTDLVKARDGAFAKMQRNVSGEDHDRLSCAISTENKPIMSFDNGLSWWLDDGRCAAQLEAKKEAEQKARDSDAEIYSYWSTTLRVDTDMDSFWLPGEERTCQTYPDDKGKVATVACTSTGTHHEHNIPVRFWGGVERNTVSDWKCRRESDDFVCRAVD